MENKFVFIIISEKNMIIFFLYSKYLLMDLPSDVSLFYFYAELTQSVTIYNQ